MGKHEVRRRSQEAHVGLTAGSCTGLTVRRFGPGPDGFTRFGPTPEPGTGLWVRFGPSAESWTGPGSGSLKVQVRTKVRNRTAASLMMSFNCQLRGSISPASYMSLLSLYRPAGHFLETKGTLMKSCNCILGRPKIHARKHVSDSLCHIPGRRMHEATDTTALQPHMRLHSHRCRILCYLLQPLKHSIFIS